MVHKGKAVVIFNNGSLVKFISSFLAYKIKIAPDLNISLIYRAADLASTHSIGAIQLSFDSLGNYNLQPPLLNLIQEL